MFIRKKSDLLAILTAVKVTTHAPVN